MSHQTRPQRLFRHASCMGLMVWASSVHAEDTYLDALIERAQEKGAGITVGARVEDGDRIEWRNVQISADDESAIMTIDWIAQVATSDGGSQMTIDPDIEIAIVDAESGRSSVLSLKNEDLIYTFQPTATGVETAFSASQVDLTQSSGNVFGGLDLKLVGVSGGHIYEPETLTSGTGNLVVDLIGMDYDLVMPEEGSISARNSIADTVLAYSYDFPEFEEGEAPDMNAVSANLTMTTGANTAENDFSQFGGPGGLSMSADGSQFEMRVRDGNGSYDAAAQNINYNVDLTSMGMPPVAVAVGELAMGGEIPVAQKDAPSDMRFGLAFRNVALDEGLWGMFDPTGALPRDDINVVLDLTGQAQVLKDFDEFDDGDGELPFQVTQAELKELTVTFAGAEIAGQGAADILYDEPMPTPVGKISYSLSGVNGLIDTLMTIGLVQPQQAMPFRMMLGMFATPVGDDQMEGNLEMNADGSILANGQRIK